MAEIYQYSDNSPYRIVYTRPGADVIVTTGYSEMPIASRPEPRRYVTEPARPSVSVVEVEERFMPSRTKSISKISEIRSKDASERTTIQTTIAKKSLSTTSDVISTKTQRTSSKTGTLYFAFGSDLSPSHLRSRARLTFDSSSRPVALARLRGWQWMISSRGAPNIVSLCEPGIYNDHGYLRTKEQDNDANFVYGLIYNLHPEDENKLDKKRGYTEHGEFNIEADCDITRKPFLQGDNTVNKIYERCEIIEWFTDPLKEGVNVVKDATSCKCLLYVDESVKGYKPGRIWDDLIDTLSANVTVAVEKYGLSKRWVESVMGQYGITVRSDTSKRSRSRSRVKEETRLDMVKYEEKDASTVSSEREREDDESTVIETRITRRVTEGYEPLPRSDFYREKRGPSKRYVSR